MQRVSFVIWVVLFCGLWGMGANDAWAQINIERLRGDDWPSGPSASIDLHFSFRSGNVDIWEVGSGGRIGYGWPRWQMFVLGNGELGWKNSIRFSNSGLVHGRVIYKWRDRVLPEGFAQINYDKSRRLDFRSLFGGGLRLGVVYSAPIKIWWGTSVMLERERFSLAVGDLHLARVWNQRWSNYISVRGSFNDRAGVGGAVYIQPLIDDINDYRILGDFSLSVDVTDRVTMVLSLNARYDSKPPLLVEKRDIKIQNRIGIKL